MEIEGKEKAGKKTPAERKERQAPDAEIVGHAGTKANLVTQPNADGLLLLDRL